MNTLMKSIGFKSSKQSKFNIGECTVIGKISQDHSGDYDSDGFVVNTISGAGKIIFGNGSVYEGDIKHNLFHGNGKLVTDDCEYSGKWIDGIFYKGDMTYNGMTIKGKWDNGNLIDKVTVIYEDNGDKYVYKGDINKEYYFHGIGKISKLVSGKAYPVYEGEFRSGQYHGFGVLYHENSPWYSGFWKESSMNGFGIIFKNNNIEQIGIFKDHIFDKGITNPQIVSNINNNKKKLTDIKYMNDLNTEIHKIIINNPLVQIMEQRKVPTVKASETKPVRRKQTRPPSNTPKRLVRQNSSRTCELSTNNEIKDSSSNITTNPVHGIAPQIKRRSLNRKPPRHPRTAWESYKRVPSSKHQRRSNIVTYNPAS